MENRWWQAWCCMLVVLAGLLDSPASRALACSCLPEHPQSHFCRADFVIVARVQKLLKDRQESDGLNVYKVNVKRIFKASEKAAVALKSSKILTPTFDSMCGLELKTRETYLLTGRVHSLEAHVGTCNYAMPWRNATARQRKGFRMLYKQGCPCKIHLSPWRTRRMPHACSARFGDCYERHGICLMGQSGVCSWARAPVLKRCLQTQHFNGTMT